MRPPVASGTISILSFCMSDFVSALASLSEVVLSKAKSLRLSVSNNSAGTCLSILSPTVILEHLFTTC